MITLRKITYENCNKILGLGVFENQKNYVADNSWSLIEAYLVLSSGGIASPYAIYSDDTPVGFLMIGYETNKDSAPAISYGNYCVWRFMIDKNFQGKGYGKAAFSKMMELIYTYPNGKAEYCWLSYHPGNDAAKNLYESFGFSETGEIFEGELLMIKKL